MALEQNEEFYEFMARLTGSVDGETPNAEPLGIKMVKRVSWTATAGEETPPSKYVTIESDWAGVFALTTTETLDAIKAAVDAELAGRA
jgi:hypothetical protein